MWTFLKHSIIIQLLSNMCYYWMYEELIVLIVFCIMCDYVNMFYNVTICIFLWLCALWCQSVIICILFVISLTNSLNKTSVNQIWVITKFKFEKSNVFTIIIRTLIGKYTMGNYYSKVGRSLNINPGTDFTKK